MTTVSILEGSPSAGQHESSSLLIVTHRRDGGAFARALDRDFHRGLLVRLARGVYCPTEVWLKAAPWDRHLLNALAYAQSVQQPFVLAGATAAAVHGLPLVSTPDTISFRAAARPSARRRDRKTPYGNRTTAETLRRALAKTGTVPHRLPDLPVVHGHWNLPSHPFYPAQTVPVTLSDGTFVGTVLADPSPIALAALMRTGDLELAVPPLDAYLHRHPDGLATVTELRDTLPSQAQKLRFDSVLALADARAESAGESLSRVVIHQLGFELPEPQVEIRDASGQLIARVDGLWKSTGLVGEFDGLQKYSGTFAGSTPPSEVVVAEKRREDALRRAGHDVARWIWSDLRNPSRLERILTQHSAPRRRA